MLNMHVKAWKGSVGLGVVLADSFPFVTDAFIYVAFFYLESGTA